MTTETTKRIEENLAYIATNPTADYPKGWVAEVGAEAVTAGMMKPHATLLGINCPVNPYPVTYGGDMEDVF